MKDQLSRPLGDHSLLGLVVDGIVVAGQTVVVALGITGEGKKVPLGLWQGTTENAATCTLKVLHGSADSVTRLVATLCWSVWPTHLR